MKGYLIKITLLLLFSVGGATSQTVLQVVSKHIEKEFPNSPRLTIDADKADIELTSWEKKTVQVSILLTAKHPDKKTAEADLKLFKVIAEQRVDGIYLRNFLSSDTRSAHANGSNFKTKFSIKVPEGMLLKIKDSFGKINIHAKTEEVNLTTNFCAIQLSNLEGKLTLDTRYGDADLMNLTSSTMIRSNRTDLKFQNFGGSLNLKSNYGKVIFSGLASTMKNLAIEANKTDILLREIALSRYAFELSNQYGELRIPSEFTLKKDEKNQKRAVFNLSNKHLISINNSFATTTIEK